ncbi:MAG: DUF302 domain-containing protein [Bacteroidota bacterium]
MKSFASILLIVLCTVVPVSIFAQSGMVKQQSNTTVNQTTQRLTETLEAKGATVFKIVDHQAGAQSVDLELRPTTVVIFGNPKLGTPLMQCTQSVAIDLPQKMLIWEDADGQVWVGYNSTEYLKERHQLSGCDLALEKIEGVLQSFAAVAAGNSN